MKCINKRSMCITQNLNGTQCTKVWPMFALSQIICVEVVLLGVKPKTSSLLCKHFINEINTH